MVKKETPAIKSRSVVGKKSPLKAAPALPNVRFDESKTRRASSGRSKKREIKKPLPEPAIVKEETIAQEIAPTAKPTGRYVYAVGRRKEATAAVKMFEEGNGRFTVNGRDLKEYFSNFQLFETILLPLKLTGQEAKHDFSIKVEGGGKHGQAEATRHGLARALVKWQAELKPTLKKAGFLTRDSRMKERKKFGLKKARKAPQWAKR